MLQDGVNGGDYVSEVGTDPIIPNADEKAAGLILEQDYFINLKRCT